MPTYEYACENCNHRFEKFQSIKARSLKKCPECGKMRLNRLIGTGAGVIFKGSGFYQTDYRSDSYKEGKKKDTPAPPPAPESGKKDKDKTKPDTCTSCANSEACQKKQA